MSHYWIAVACQKHVARGRAESICQVCHGKAEPLKRMKEGDWIIYYSPTVEFGKKEPYRCFTAIGRVKPKPPYQHEMSPDFIPWRRDIAYIAAQDAAIEPLIEKLHFIADKTKWGFPFRRGCFTINEADFRIIATAMGVSFEA